jgi:hypothetical protein
VGHDVRRGFVSIEAARSRYGVVANAAGDVDEAATKIERGKRST